jgi:perosamine synthetase
MTQIKYPWAIPDIGDEEIEAVTEVLKQGWISGTTPFNDQLEKEFSRIIGVKYSVTVSNGTAALILGLLALRERAHLNIAVPSWTYIATVNSAQLFGKFKLVDCDKDSFCIKISDIPKRPLVMPVDIGGCPPDYDAIRSLPWKPIIFADSAEGIGSLYKGNPVGSQADLHMFSLHATKVVTAGEGGMLTTNDKDLYDRLKALNNQGYGSGHNPWDYNHPSIGYNFRMPALQCVITLEQLKKLPRYLKMRQEFAKIYHDILGDKVGYQKVPAYGKSGNFLFTILVDPKKKIDFIKDMARDGVQCKAWKPVHMQPPYLKYKDSLPNSEWLYERNVHLPIHNKLTEEDVKDIATIARRLL